MAKPPKGASYEYAVLPHTDAAALKHSPRNPLTRFSDKTATPILYALRQTVLLLTSCLRLRRLCPNGGLLQKADTSCLDHDTQYKDKLLLTVSQPDLALYRGLSDEAFDKDGKRIERSIYSRPWTDNESQEIPVTVTLKDSEGCRDALLQGVVGRQEADSVAFYLPGCCKLRGRAKEVGRV